MIERIRCKNNPKNSSTTRIREHISSVFSMSAISSFRTIENKHDVYRGKNCLKMFYEFLRYHAMKIISKRKKMKFLTKEQQESYENAKISYICKGNFENRYLKDKKYCKVRDHHHDTGEYRSAVHNICTLKYSVTKKIPVVFHNGSDGSNYDYHSIIKELAEEFRKQFTYLGDNTEKCITFTVPTETEVTRIYRNGEVTKYICYILQFIDSARYMDSLLSNFVNNLSEGIHRIKCKFRHNDKKMWNMWN